MKHMKKVFLSTMLAMLATAVTACGATGQKADQNANAATGGAQTYVVGTDASYPPFEKQESNQIVGFDIDIIKAVAEAEGMNINIRHTGWDGLFEGIDNGKVDIGISAVTIDEKRKKTKDFSNPYFDAKQLILVPENSSVTKLDDLKGKKIGVQSATTGEMVVQEKFGKTYQGLKGYDDAPAAVDDLLNGRVDAVVADNVVMNEYVKKFGSKGFKVVDDPSFKPEHYGIMVKKGNTELLKKIDDGLKKIKDNGKYDQIYNQYFGKK